MRLLIDDKRDMPDGIIARDFESGKKMLALGGFDVLYLDHDLGEINTGYDIINWASEYADEILPPKIVVVSSNPVGLENIGRALVSFGYKRVGTTFTKEK